MSTSNPKMVSAVFRNRLDAQAAYDRLLQRGYGSGEINLLVSDTTHQSLRNFADETKDATHAGSQAAEGAAVGGAVGTAIGAGLAAALAIGTSLLIPGIGVVAGPLAAGLAGAGAGAVSGGVIGALIGWGIPEADAQVYQEALRQGGIVMGVVPRNSKDAQAIKEDFEDLHGESICYC